MALLLAGVALYRFGHSAVLGGVAVLAAPVALAVQLLRYSGSLVSGRFVLSLVLAPSVGLLVVPVDVVGSFGGLSDVHPVIVFSYGRHLLLI